MALRSRCKAYHMTVSLVVYMMYPEQKIAIIIIRLFILFIIIY